MNKTGNRMRRSRMGASGFSLVETVIAIAVIAFTFIVIIGMLGLGVANDQTSSEQTVATNIAASIIADLRSTPNYSPNSTRYNLTLPTTTTAISSVTPTILYFDNAQNIVTSSASPAYKAYVYLTQTVSIGTAPAQTTDLVRVAVAWPAQTTTPAAGYVDILTQFRVN
jgi:uncharacterized protein (TIGR02598 family)